MSRYSTCLFLCSSPTQSFGTICGSDRTFFTFARNFSFFNTVARIQPLLPSQFSVPSGNLSSIRSCIPSFTPETFWTVNWFTLGLESLLKFIVIAEIFSRLLENYSSIAKLGRVLYPGVGVLITLAAALAAAYTPKDGNFSIVSGVHILEQTSI